MTIKQFLSTAAGVIYISIRLKLYKIARHTTLKCPKYFVITFHAIYYLSFPAVYGRKKGLLYDQKSKLLNVPSLHMNNYAFVSKVFLLISTIKALLYIYLLKMKLNSLRTYHKQKQNL